MKVSFTLISTFFLLLATKYLFSNIEKERKKSAAITQRYEALSAAASDAIWDHDLTTGSTFYNERIFSIFKYSRSETMNNSFWWSENIHPEDKKRVEGKINSYLVNGTSCWEEEYRFRCKDGSYKIVYDRSYIIFNEQNQPIRLIGAMKDITDLRNSERLKQEKQLEKKNKAGRDIINSQETERKRIKDELQEDVNQILASIKLNINSLEKNELANSESHKASIIFLNEAIAKIRALSKTLNSATFDYFGLVAAIGELSITTDTDFGIKIKTETDYFDETLTDRSLQLLLFRIIQEQITSLSNKQVTEVYISLSNRNSLTQLKVIDNRKLIDNETEEDKTENESFSDIRSKLEMYKGNLYITSSILEGRELKVVI